MNNVAVYFQHTVIAPLREPFNDTPCLGNGRDVSLEGFFMSEFREIPLTQGQFAIVDEEDYDFLMQWKWYAMKCGRTFYAVRKFYKDKNTWMHRLINQTPNGMDTDHINGNGLDNRRCNLRSVTRQQNQCNKKQKNNGTSKYKGVCWHKDAKKWMAQIRVNKTHIGLGFFNSEEAARDAYDAASKKYHGEYGRPN